MLKIKYEPEYLPLMVVLSFVFIGVLVWGCATASRNKDTDSNIIEIRVERNQTMLRYFGQIKPGAALHLLLSVKQE